jgi:F-type H+-transporting ATPase subunit epsilon
MHLSIYSLKRTIFDGEAESVNVRTAAGEITILEHHRPLISMLLDGVLKVVADGQEKFFPVRSGFIEVQKENSVRILADEA